VTSEDVASELDKIPFAPFRIHLVSGKMVDIPDSGLAFMLQNAVMVFQRQQDDQDTPPHDIISLRNIERLEQLPTPTQTGGDHAR
jgi:hypothetical protein